MPASRPVTHDADVARTLLARSRWLEENADVTSHDLSGNILRMWEGWEPVHVGCSDTDPDWLWVFVHPDHGWGLTALPDARTRWSHGQRRALVLAYVLSASGTSVLSMCQRVLHAGTSSTGTGYAVATVRRVLALPQLSTVVTDEQVEFWLAFHPAMTTPTVPTVHT